MCGGRPWRVLAEALAGKPSQSESRLARGAELSPYPSRITSDVDIGKLLAEC